MPNQLKCAPSSKTGICAIIRSYITRSGSITIHFYGAWWFKFDFKSFGVQWQLFSLLMLYDDSAKWTKMRKSVTPPDCVSWQMFTLCIFCPCWEILLKSWEILFTFFWPIAVIADGSFSIMSSVNWQTIVITRSVSIPAFESLCKSWLRAQCNHPYTSDNLILMNFSYPPLQTDTLKHTTATFHLHYIHHRVFSRYSFLICLDLLSETEKKSLYFYIYHSQPRAFFQQTWYSVFALDWAVSHFKNNHLLLWIKKVILPLTVMHISDFMS